MADEDDTNIHVIEGYFLDILFDYYPPLSGRFYHYLATVLSTRLKLRESSQAKKLKDETTESEDNNNSKDDFGTISKRRNQSRSMLISGDEDGWTPEHKKKTKSQRPTNIESRKKEKKERKQKRGSKLNQEQQKLEEQDEDKLSIAEKLEEKPEERKKET